jgi:predicted aspartyl protease
VLTGCVQAASVVGEAGSAKLRFRVTPLQEHPSAWLTDTSVHGPSASEVEPAAPASYFEDYWTAVADLDFATLRTVARSEPEIGFVDGLFSLAGGNQSKAESAFTKGRQLEEINLAVASQMMLAATLLYERKWVKLRDLTIGAPFEVVDRGNTIELERWGRAFATADRQETILPGVPVSLPLRMTSLGTPTVRVRINGKEYDFWIDTGSGITVLSSDVAADAKVPSTSTDTLTVRTFAGKVSVRPAVVKRMEIGPIVFINSPAVIIEASQMLLRGPGEGPPQGGVHVDGIIGWDTIRQLDVVLDYQDRKITISRPAIPDTHGAASQNLKWVGRPLVEVRTKTGKVLHFTLDTGAQASFLNASVLEKAGITARNYDARVFGLGSTGASTNKIIPNLTLAVAGRSLHLERVFVYGPAWSGIINCDGIFGSDIGQFGQIRIDATNGLFSVGD